MLLSVSVAYPGTLGPTIPQPPSGYIPTGTGYTAMSRNGVGIEWSSTLMAWVNPVTGVAV